MMRVKSNLSRLAAMAAVAALALAVSTTAAFADAGFDLRNSFSATPPDFNGVAYNGTNIVVYGLPGTALYPGPVASSFDLAANVTGASESVTGYGVIMTISGGAGVTFNPAPIAGGANPPNNIPYSLTSPSNTSLDIQYGTTNVQGGGLQSIGIVALNDVPATNVTLSDNDGLANVPIAVAGGVGFNQPSLLETRTLNVGSDPVYTGFINAAGQIITNPTLGTTRTIEIRESVTGDLNGDGFADFGDIVPFVDVMLNGPEPHQAANPFLQVTYVADFGGGPGGNCDKDGFADFADIVGFTNTMLFGDCAGAGGSPSAVPEPSTLIMLPGFIAAAYLVYRRRMRRA
jgi:hypothetical protein